MAYELLRQFAMLNHNFLRRTFQAVLLCLFLLPALSQAQQRDKVTTLEDDLKTLQKDFFSLQKELLDLEKTVARSGISESTRTDLAKLNEIDVLKANIDKLSAQIETLNNRPSGAAPAAVVSSSSGDDSGAVTSLKTEVGSLSGKVDQLQAQIKKVMDSKAIAPPAAAPAAAAPAATALTPEDVAKLTAADDDQKYAINMMWTLITGAMVMFMQAGFAMVECGFTRAKHVAHTACMNFMVYSISILAYWAIGFAIQFGGTGDLDHSVSTVGTLGTVLPEKLNHLAGISFGDKFFGLFGTQGFFLSPSFNDGGIFTLFLFQMIFGGTAAIIPTGAMAERWKFSAFALSSVFICGFVYPLFGCWTWGGGWLAALGKNFGLGHGHVDFAGSSVVHVCGGALSFVWAKKLGPRYGKYNKDGSPNPIPGHNIPMGILGTFILAFGWFGFNPGSTLSGMDHNIGITATNTMLASASGAVLGMLTSWWKIGKPDPSFMCNGMLGGLVAITAPSAFVDSWAAVLIGAISGVLVVYATLFVETNLKLDDPVGAVPVHGCNGVWGVLSLGLFANGAYGAGFNGVGATEYLGKPVVPGQDFGGGVTGLFYGDPMQFVAQFIGTSVCVLMMAGFGWCIYMIVDKIVGGQRVDTADEIGGLDIAELGVEGYPKDANPTPK